MSVAGAQPSVGMAVGAASPLPLEEIQGIILRGYNFDFVRHFVLVVTAADSGRRLVGKLADGPEPRISTSEDWGANRPAYRLQMGFTFAGLKAIGLTDETLAGFAGHVAFTQGAVARAAEVGDIDANAPENWISSLRDDSGVHAVVSLYAADSQTLDQLSATLKQLWDSGFAVKSEHKGQVLPDHSVHFGYQDGISQPTIEDAPPPSSPSKPFAPIASFLLGYTSPWPAFDLAVPAPDEFGRNGSFAAFRILRQDVAAFEQFLTVAAAASGRDREWIAAKLCGRWRSGVPLSLSPDSATPQPELRADQLDDFDYADDSDGQKCPFGAHTRRSFPRNDRIAGGEGAAFRHRIIRRGMPYGPPFDPAVPDNQERGLLGLFICASIEIQFEFILGQWLNRGGFTGALAIDSHDPFLGSQPAGGRKLAAPSGNGPAVQISGLQQFVTTRGGAYLFLPSLSGLRFIGKQ